MRVVVVGAGIAGLAAAFRLDERARRDGAPLELTVLEAEGRAGGHAATLRDGGWLIEAGPHAFVHRAAEPRVMELVQALGLEPELIEPRPAARRRYVFHGGRLRQVPGSPFALIGSDALSARGKLRLMLEPWAPRARAGAEETVADFARRRLGDEVARVLVDPVMAGISAGDSRRLSAPASFPALVRAERAHGSLLRAAVSSPRGERPRMLGLRHGMGSLIAALAARLGPRLRTATAVRALARRDGAWRVSLAGGETLVADRVVLAAPAGAAADLLAPLDPVLADALRAFPSAPVAVVALAYARSDVRALEGYGFLVPALERLDTMGTVWESSVFDGRAAEGTVLLRSMLGGARRPQLASLDERELEARARRELERVLGITAPPLRQWVWRWRPGITQYELGHEARVRTARERAAAHAGLELAGSSYDGVSFTAAARSGTDAADRLLAGRVASGDRTAAPAAARSA